MHDELVSVILNGDQAEKEAAKAAAVAIYGEAEGTRRWTQASDRAERVLADGGDIDACEEYLRSEAVTGVGDAITAALTGLSDAVTRLDALNGGAYTPAYDPDVSAYGADLAAHLATAATALRAAKAINSWHVTATTLRATVAELGACPPVPGDCRHGQPWPCQVTRAHWTAHGRDPSTEKRRAFPEPGQDSWTRAGAREAAA